MTYGDELTLKEASVFAGVSETTMRVWVKEVDGISRSPGGGYRIPRVNLQKYLAGKNSRSITGASYAPKTKDDGSSEGQLLAQLRGELDRLRTDLTERKSEVKELKIELREAQIEIRRLEAELRAHLSGGVVGAVSRWIKGR